MIARTSLGGWRWPYESEFDGNLLLEELVVIGALDCSLCFIEGGVFDEDVTLKSTHQHVYIIDYLSPSRNVDGHTFT
jgi:hypothetical protein